jgi:putative colanic acid biosynthesis glycosyltransferase WcaI
VTGATVHVLSQYLWPDDAPTGIYAEQLADSLAGAGARVRLVGGQGSYRPGRRAAPRTPIERVTHYEGRRGGLLSTAREYESVREAFGRYIRSQVGGRDVVVLTSAPPTTLFLHRAIRDRQAIGVYWLQDYYPQLIRAVWDAPGFMRQRLDQLWRRELAAWPHVVKAAGNLAYSGANATVIRNWNTLELGVPAPARPRTALYSGNLGWGHDLPAFLELCRRLRDDGYEITVRGDGPGMAKLPDWIRAAPPLVDEAELARSYWDAEVHLVAGHPALPDAVFPSKFWNAMATGRPVLASGFTGVMAEELEAARRADYKAHLSRCTALVVSILEGAPPENRAGRSESRAH